MIESKFGDKLSFEEPPKKPKGWYVQKAKGYTTQFLKAIKDGTCTTGMAKVPMNPNTNKEEQLRLYNAFKSLRRRSEIDVDVSIIENDLWLIYEGEQQISK